MADDASAVVVAASAVQVAAEGPDEMDGLSRTSEIAIVTGLRGDSGSEMNRGDRAKHATDGFPSAPAGLGMLPDEKA